MSQPQYKRDLRDLRDEYGSLGDVAGELPESVSAQWLSDILNQPSRQPSESLVGAIQKLASKVRQDRSPDQRELIQKIRDIKEEFGSWDRVGRRVGMASNPLRLAVMEGTPLSDEQARKVEKAHRYVDLKHILAELEVGSTMQAICALEELSVRERLTERQEEVLDELLAQTEEYHRLLQTGNIDELKAKICDDS